MNYSFECLEHELAIGLCISSCTYKNCDTSRYVKCCFSISNSKTFLNSVSNTSNSCCQVKILGDEIFRLEGEGDTEEYGCEDRCKYRKDGDSIGLYCFQDGGELESQCKGEFIST